MDNERNNAAPAGEPSKIVFSARQIALRKFAAFKKENLLEALLADPVIREALRNAGTSTEPKTVGDLVKTINEGAEIRPTKATAEAPDDVDSISQNIRLRNTRFTAWRKARWRCA